MPHGGLPPFLLIATPIPVAQLVYKALVDTLYLLMLNLLCIPFPLLLTHPQALSLRLQPELLGHNITLPHHQSKLTITWNTKYLTFWTARLAVRGSPYSFTTSSGQVTKAQMRRTYGLALQN